MAERADASTPAAAQASLDRWCVEVADQRRRDGLTVAALAAAEPLLPLPPVAYPAELRVERVVSASALVAFEGNRYSVPPSLAGQTVTVLARLGEPTLRVVSAAGVLVATHRRLPAGAGQIVRDRRAPGRARAGRARRVHDQAALRAQAEPAAERARRSTLAAALSPEALVEPELPTLETYAALAAAPMREQGVYQQLRSHLAYLRLAAAAEQLPAALEQAEQEKLSHTRFLERLLAAEVEATERRRLEGRIRFASFPTQKTLADDRLRRPARPRPRSSSTSSRRCASSRSTATCC